MLRDMPSSTHTEPYLKQLDTIIGACGFAVIPVGYGGCSVPECCGPVAEQPWMYTVGLSQWGLSEFVLMGLNPGDAQRTLHHLAGAELTGRPQPLDRTLAVEGTLARLLDVPDEWLLTDPSRMAAWFGYQSRERLTLGLPRVRQVVWADAQGRFPDDVGVRPQASLRQPILRDDPVSQPHRSSRELKRASRHRRAA